MADPTVSLPPPVGRVLGAKNDGNDAYDPFSVDDDAHTAPGSDPKGPGIEHVGAAMAVVFNAKGEYCLSAGVDTVVRLWNPFTGLHISAFEGHGKPVTTLACSSDSSAFLSAGEDRAVFVWDVAGGIISRRFYGHLARINCVAWAGDGDSLVASGSYDALVHIYDMRSRRREPIQVLRDTGDSVTGIVVHSGSSTITTSSVDGKLRQYDIRNGRMISDETGHPITAIAQSRDGQCLLASCTDSTVKLLDVSSGALLSTYKGGHQSKEYRVGTALTHEEAHVVVGSETGSVFVYDLINADVVATLDGYHLKHVTDVACHPTEAGLILSAGADGRIVFWDWKGGDFGASAPTFRDLLPDLPESAFTGGFQMGKKKKKKKPPQ